MIHAIDRDSPLFTPSTADKINKKTSLLWKRIQDMNIPAIEYKEPIVVEPFSWAYGLNTSPSFALLDNCFCIGGHLHVVNLAVQFSVALPSWFKVGSLITPVLSTVFLPGVDGSWIIRIEEGSADVQLITFDTSPKYIYCVYIT